MTQDQQRRVNALWVTSRGRLTQDDCIEIVTESDYQRMHREQCDPPWSIGLFIVAWLIVFGWLGLVAVLEGSL
jgi:hypothetical protein